MSVARPGRWNFRCGVLLVLIIYRIQKATLDTKVCGMLRLKHSARWCCFAVGKPDFGWCCLFGSRQDFQFSLCNSPEKIEKCKGWKTHVTSSFSIFSIGLQKCRKNWNLMFEQRWMCHATFLFSVSCRYLQQKCTSSIDSIDDMIIVWK